MKKLVLLLALTTVVSIGAFAERPSGWGIGIMGQYGLSWDGFDASGGAALSLKAPQYPIYWGIQASFRNDYFRIGVTGDYYLIDQILISDVHFGWYIGIGGYAGLVASSGNLGVFAGARLPVGLYIMPVDTVPLEIFAEIAPTSGISINNDGFNFPDGGLQFGIGVRLWF